MNKQRLSLILGAVLLLPGLAAAQTCPAGLEKNAPNDRYTNNGDGTITDNDTGLMWKRCAEGKSGGDCSAGSPGLYTWPDALLQAQTVNGTTGDSDANPGDRTDWRVPNVKELMSLVERACTQPSINESRFPNTPKTDSVDIGGGVIVRTGGRYWSSTPHIDAGDPTAPFKARTVDFQVGNDDRPHKLWKDANPASTPNAFYLRLVRNAD